MMRSLWELVRATRSTSWAVLLAVIPGRRRLASWGATEDERRRSFAGDAVMPDADVRWVRAVTVRASADEVWPWVAQIARGAGYYSYDVLDNGRKPSARHLLSIPAPAVGDHSEGIGDVVLVEAGRDIVWQSPELPFLGSRGRMVLGYAVVPTTETTCRVVTLVLARIRGRTAWLAKSVFSLMDYVMASEQLRGLKHRVESTGAPREARPCAGPADHQRDPVVFAGT